MTHTRLVEEIKERTEIVDFISRYLRLSRSGQNWKGLCPFHSEKTPSFTVNQAKQIFHCFGCGAGGDVITFLMKYENISFHESLEFLAKAAGIKLPENRTGDKTYDRDEKIRKALNHACGFFINKLKESAKTGSYLERRGLSHETVETFKLGFAPIGWRNLLDHLKKAGFDEPTIRAAGLAVSGEKGTYDMFRERLIFPITNASGAIIAFGGRVIADKTDQKTVVPKYINSPETPVFRKSETLFGLYNAKESIKRENRVVIVEGYMDVIICHQYGITNAVAPLGTSLTPGHVSKLRTFTNRAVLVFDGDVAGRAAAKRALPVICENNYMAKVLLLPENEDPDSFLRRHGAGAFNALLAEAKSIIDFLFEFKGADQADIVKNALSLIAVIRDPIFAGEMLTRLSDRTRMNETMLREEFNRIRKKQLPEDARNPKAGLPSMNSEEYMLLSIAISFPDKTDEVLSGINIGEIKEKTLAALFRKLAALENKVDFINDILRNGDKEEKRLVARFLEDPGFDPACVDQSMEDCFRRIKRIKILEENKRLDEKIRIAEMSGDASAMNSLLLEKKKFMRGVVL